MCSSLVERRGLCAPPRRRSRGGAAAAARHVTISISPQSCSAIFGLYENVMEVLFLIALSD
jgi:hypothetical protein